MTAAAQPKTLPLPQRLLRAPAAAARRLLPPLVAILLAMFVCGIIIAVMGYNPVAAYVALLESAIGSKSSIGTTIAKSLPLLIAGMGVIIAYRAEIFNIGIEGQILVGGLFSAWVTTTFTGLPAVIHVPLGLAAGIFGGALYAYIPGWLRAKKGINEVIVTLLMNYVAALLASWAVPRPPARARAALRQDRQRSQQRAAADYPAGVPASPRGSSSPSRC